MKQFISCPITVVFVMGLCFAATTHAGIPGLVGYWPFDGDILDYSGNERHGSLLGSPPFVTGVEGMALDFNGSDDRVDIAGFKGIMGGNPWTFAAWFRTASDGERRILANWGINAGGSRVEMRIHHTATDFRVSSGSGNVTTFSAVNDGEWHHVAVVARADADTISYPGITIYLDGADDTEPTTDPDAWNIAEGVDMAIGGRATHSDRYWQGAADEAALFDRDLTPEEVIAVMNGDFKDVPEASQPIPANGASDVERDGLEITWAPGISAEQHDIYLGTSFEDVNGATTDDDAYRGRQAENSVSLERLELGRTYYWRVDEVDAPPASTLHRGTTWSFTVEAVSYAIPIGDVSATASSSEAPQDVNNLVNGSGLNENDEHDVTMETMWLSGPDDAEPWIQFEFAKAQKLDKVQVWNHNSQAEGILGYGIKEALVAYSLDGENWSELGILEIPQSPGTFDYAGTDLSLNGIVARFLRLTGISNWATLPIVTQLGLSEVRFFAEPVYPRLPQPPDGATLAGAEVTLQWHPGREAASHEVYLSRDPNAVLDGSALVGTVEVASFDTGPLDYATAYSWRVIEVNEAMPVPSFASDLWQFSTPAVGVIDDMEDYRPEEGLFIWQHWADGFEIDDNGALVGNGDEPEKTVVRGSQSMPLHYNNSTAPRSEATQTLPAWDFTASGVQGLVLYFQGSPLNTGGALYLKINDRRIDFDGDVAHLTRPGWTKWYVPIAGSDIPEFESVETLTIGIEGSGTGTLYVDDILLTPEPRSLVIPTEPGTEGLLGHYPLDGDASDSTGQHPGTLIAEPFFEDGYLGQAVRLDGFTSYVELTGFKGILGTEPITVCAWINTISEDSRNIAGWGTNVNGERFLYRIQENRLRCAHGNGNVQGYMTVSDGEWHHTATTVEAGATISYPAVRLYVDGYEDTRPSTDPDPFNIVAGEDIRIGSRPGDDDRYFDGLIDELRIYQRALSAGEIAGMAGVTTPYDN